MRGRSSCAAYQPDLGNVDEPRPHWRRAGATGRERPRAGAGRGRGLPPDAKEAPTVGGGGSSEPLSDKLAQSKGVICPPAGMDRDLQVRPPGGGALKVIPPPGTPGGDPRVEPR
jgi:hypothetical protein